MNGERTDLTVKLEIAYEPKTEAAALRQRIIKGAFYASSLFKVIPAVNDSVEGDVMDIEHLCEIGEAVLSAVISEADRMNFIEGFSISERYTGKPEIDELAVMISTLLNHPNIPQELYSNLSEAITDFFNSDIDQTEIKEFFDSPEYIAKILDGYVDLSKADEE